MCFTERRIPALIITIFSVIVIICGIIMIIQSCIYQITNSILTQDLGEYTSTVINFKNASFGVLVSFSATAVILGTFGTCCLCRPFKSSIIFPICYGFTLFGVWIVVLILGITLTAVSTSGQSVIQGFCDGNPIISKLDFVVS